MTLSICGVALLEFESETSFVLKRLAMDDKSLKKLSNSFQMPTLNRLPEFDEKDKNIYNASNRFKISRFTKENYLFFLTNISENFLAESTESDWLKSVDDLFDENNTFNPNIVLYDVVIKNQNQEAIEYVYINEFKKTMLAKDQRYFYGKKKFAGDLNAVSIGVSEVKQSFVLPDKNFAGRIAKIKGYENEQDCFELHVYKAFLLDSLFSLKEITKKYAKKKLKRFVSEDEQNKFKLTINNSDVLFEDEFGNDRTTEVIAEVINSDYEHLQQTFATFTGRSNKIIQTIELTQLEKVTNDLFDYIDDPQTDNLFTKEEVPRIDTNENKVYVNEKSIRIFAAMLNNQIIRKLLDGTIEIPYYQEN